MLAGRLKYVFTKLLLMRLLNIYYVSTRLPASAGGKGRILTSVGWQVTL